MCINIILSVSYNIYVYWFISLDGFIYEGFDDDGEFGVGWVLLKILIDNEVINVLVVVLCWYGSKIGFWRFIYINDVGMSVVKNM